jgi:signal transduction histidine kinase/ligand-binding sensor domain-containing protein
MTWMRARIGHWVLAACVLIGAGAAHALDASLDVNQYGHRAWRVREGFAKGPINAVVQTPDGYLWLGTPLGLLRFDGVRAVEWKPPSGATLPDQRIRVLAVGRDGRLWIGTLNGLASWDGRTLAVYPRFDGTFINGIAEDDEGTVWVTANPRDVDTTFVCGVRASSVTCHGEDGSLGHPWDLFRDSKGAVWMTSTEGIWRWRPGAPVRYDGPSVAPAGALADTRSGGLLVATRQGIRQLGRDGLEPYPLPAIPDSSRFRSLLVDRDGALWIGTIDGLVHVHHGRADTFTRRDGLLDAVILRLFEDREGNVWVATTEGLERFRALAVSRDGVEQGLSGNVASVTSHGGHVWVATGDGLRRSNAGRWSVVRGKKGLDESGVAASPASDPGVGAFIVTGLPDTSGASLFEDSAARLWIAAPNAVGWIEGERFVPLDDIPAGYIDAFDEDAQGGVWFSHRRAGISRVSRDGSREHVPWEALGIKAIAWRLAVDRMRGGVWIGFYDGGIVYVSGGRVRESYGVREGLGKGTINALRTDERGALWAATEGGFSRIANGRVATLDARSGLPCDEVKSFIDDAEGSIWLYTACGLARIARKDLDAWAAERDRGRAQLRVPMSVLDPGDGIPVAGTLGSFTPTTARAPDGRLWFKVANALFVVDPAHLPFNKLPPPVAVEQVVADGTAHEPSSGPMRLPPLVRDVVIEYTALSFVAPEKVRFRYQLEGQDANWREVVNERKVQYSNLAPGRYRFRVTASNNSGVWNEEGATLDVEVAPAFWQTNWFRALCVIALAALLFGLYILRVRQLRRRFALTLETRVAERTRIARDLHDTLLQSFHGLLLRFQTVSALLPGRAAEAKAMLDNTIDQAADAITEGRDAVQALRTSTTEMNNLAASLRAFGDELRAENGGDKAAAIRVEVLGVTRALHPIVRDEVFRIAAEALRNALRHAASAQIEIEIVYDRQQFRLRVRDDGKGIDPQVLAQHGREGHFGLEGMRERAAVVGGKLTVWSALDAGTEIELTVPAANAYVAGTGEQTSGDADKARETD